MQASIPLTQLALALRPSATAISKREIQGQTKPLSVVTQQDCYVPGVSGGLVVLPGHGDVAAKSLGPVETRGDIRSETRGDIRSAFPAAPVNDSVASKLSEHAASVLPAKSDGNSEVREPARPKSGWNDDVKAPSLFDTSLTTASIFRRGPRAPAAITQDAKSGNSTQSKRISALPASPAGMLHPSGRKQRSRSRQPSSKRKRRGDAASPLLTSSDARWAHITSQYSQTPRSASSRRSTSRGSRHRSAAPVAPAALRYAPSAAVEKLARKHEASPAAGAGTRALREVTADLLRRPPAAAEGVNSPYRTLPAQPPTPIAAVSAAAALATAPGSLWEHTHRGDDSPAAAARPLGRPLLLPAPPRATAAGAAPVTTASTPPLPPSSLAESWSPPASGSTRTEASAARLLRDNFSERQESPAPLPAPSPRGSQQTRAPIAPASPRIPPPLAPSKPLLHVSDAARYLGEAVAGTADLESLLRRLSEVHAAEEGAQLCLAAHQAIALGALAASGNGRVEPAHARQLRIAAHEAIIDARVGRQVDRRSLAVGAVGRAPEEQLDSLPLSVVMSVAEDELAAEQQQQGGKDACTVNESKRPGPSNGLGRGGCSGRCGSVRPTAVETSAGAAEGLIHNKAVVSASLFRRFPSSPMPASDLSVIFCMEPAFEQEATTHSQAVQRWMRINDATLIAAGIDSVRLVSTAASAVTDTIVNDFTAELVAAVDGVADALMEAV
jgi:hypothetical protein